MPATRSLAGMGAGGCGSCGTKGVAAAVAAVGHSVRAAAAKGAAALRYDLFTPQVRHRFFCEP
eukprot:1217903-Heterocapsa_arctica.AAC.1